MIRTLQQIRKLHPFGSRQFLTKTADPYNLSSLQRLALIPYFGIGSLMDPTRGDLVAGFGDVTGTLALKKLTGVIKRSGAGRVMLSKKPHITSSTLNLDYLRNLPDSTFGRKYINFMDDHHFSADER